MESRLLLTVMFFSFVALASPVKGYSGDHRDGEVSVTLYKDFTVGMSYAAVKNKPNVIDAAALGIQLPESVRLYCLEEFAGRQAALLFVFNDNALTEISLLLLDQGGYHSVVEMLSKDFTLVNMQSETESLDCFTLYLMGSQNIWEEPIKRFEQAALNVGILESTFIDSISLQKATSSLSGGKSSGKIIEKLPKDTRMVVLKISPESPIMLTFSAPKI